MVADLVGLLLVLLMWIYYCRVLIKYGFMKNLPLNPTTTGGGGHFDPQHYSWFRCDLTALDNEPKLGDFSQLCLADILGKNFFPSMPACRHAGPA